MLYFDENENIHFFESKEEQLEKYREYGYISPKAKKLKTLYYKMDNSTYPSCEVIGFLIPNNPKLKEICVIVEIEGKRGMVHKDYLKEMQEMKRKFDQSLPIQTSLFE